MRRLIGRALAEKTRVEVPIRWDFRALVLLGALLAGSSSCEGTTSALPPPDGGCVACPPEASWAAGPGGSIWRLVGETWLAQRSPSEDDLFGLWGADAYSVWAVGASGTALHFDGSSWNAVPTGVDVTLRDIHGTGEDDVWAVGDGGVIVHWDGGRWSSVDGPSREDLRTVWASTPNQAWIGGPTGSLLEWDGDTWRVLPISTRPLVVTDLAGLSATDLWAVTAERRDCIDSGSTLEAGLDGASSQVLHRDQDGWREAFALPDDGAQLRGVVALDQDDVWVVGAGAQDWDAVVLRWDGVRWFAEDVTGAALTAAWGTTPDQLWSGGFDGLFRRGDRAWTREGAVGAVNAIWGPGQSRSGCAEDCESLALPDPPAIEPSPCATAAACEGGLCDAVAGDGSCSCPEGFHAEERVCVADRPCTRVTCSGIGTCVEEDGVARCECPPGTVEHGGFACAPLPVDGTCSSDGWCVELPLPMAHVTGLWADAPDDVWAVGPGGDVARRSGDGWQRLDLGTRMSLVDVSGTGPDNVWIAGLSAIYHWDGTSLAEVKVDCTAGAYGEPMSRYRSIEAVASDQVWLVGDRHVQNDDLLVETGLCHFDGRRWHAVRWNPSVNPWGECGKPFTCEDVWSSPGGDIWCSGYGGALFDGSLIEMPGLKNVRDLWPANADDVWAIDGWGELFHWQGGGWTSTGTTGVEAIDGVSADDVWVAGDHVEHWDGTQWNVVDRGTAPTNGFGAEVTAIGANEAVVAASADGLISRLIHYVGATRTEESLPASMATRVLWGASADDVWVAGDNGMAHWNGMTWTPVEVPGLLAFHDLLGFAADDIWALGYDLDSDYGYHPRLARFDGEWTSMAPADLDFGSPVVERSLSWVSGTAADDVWLYGEEMRSEGADWESFIAHWNGASWSRSAAPSPVQAMWATSNHVWVTYFLPGTSQSMMSRWDGATWQDFGPPIDGGVRDIFGFANDNIWAAGDGGLLLHWDGSTWRSLDSGSDADFQGLWGAGSDDVWLAGGRPGTPLERGVLLHFDGSQWSPQRLPTTASVDHVFGVDGELWATGVYLLHRE